LAALVVRDWRAGERHLAYPLTLAFFLLVHLLLGPVSGSEWWSALMRWLGGATG